MILVSVGLILTVSISLFMARRDGASRRDPSTTAASRPAEAPAAPVIPPPSSPLEKQEAVLQALLGFANAGSAAERLKRTADPGLTAAMLEEHASSHPGSIPEAVFNPTVTAVSMGGREIILVSFLDHRHRPTSAPFEWLGGAYKLHWEAMTAHCPVPWPVLIENRPAGNHTMRGKIYLADEHPAPQAPAAPPTVLVSHPDLAKPLTLDLSPEVARLFASFPRFQDIPGIFEVTCPTDSPHLRLNRWIQRDWIR